MFNLLLTLYLLAGLFLSTALDWREEPLLDLYKFIFLWPVYLVIELVDYLRH